MDTMNAFAMGEANRGKELMVFDWEKAARLIKQNKVNRAYAGLSDDWEWTGGIIFENGKPVPIDRKDVYLASTWATPELQINSKIIPCYKMQNETPNWDAETYWPEEALKILNSN